MKVMTVDFDEPGFAARVRARESDALEAVVKEYLPQILRAARGAGLDVHRAEDVAQATFTTFLESAERFEGRSHVRTWLFGILYKKIAEERRRVQKDSKMDDIDDLVDQRFDDGGRWVRPPRPVDEAVFRREVSEGIDTCLEGVSGSQRMAFVLREIEGMTTEEICKILDVTRTNLGVLLFRARNRLRECLEQRGVTVGES